MVASITASSQSHGRHFHAPRVSLRPAGDLTLIGQGTQEMQIAAVVLATGDGGAELIVDGEPHGA